ncbi:hypothetical protein KC365_g16764 [Hortaea werneckii]|nr:hypothetical protein KC342_g3343 [Hortaea werneckii]KAI7106772.1 hypothetical protein KC339_g2850 [Hortaea werneckii]KAI7207071.1 hypothetical protein KC365_g16764 [Hortaea werneckii]KAI7465678.1 hypothetical protein KC351_g14852 [Hortaea werneckii]
MSESEGCTSTDDGTDTTLSNSDDDHRPEANPRMSSLILFLNIATGSTIAPPSLCLSGECRDTYCEHCAGNSLASDEDQSCYQNSEESSVSKYENDEEHFDPFEITGMLYEPKEPSILLACKEIRKQCLPQYYASSAFSWRFEWLNYKDSLSHFFGWVDHVVKEHTREMTGVSFQGRHVVEEGVDFDADIDLLTCAPFFHVKVAATHNDEPLKAILVWLKRHLTDALCEKLRTNGSRALTTEADLKELGESLSVPCTGIMNTTVVLDQGGSHAYTNLDEITGRVIVRCGKSADVNSIIVKLEGESRTRLMSSGGGPNNERPKPQLEYHKILYRVQTVFPPADVLEGRSQSGSKATYTLPPGNHEYPFKFKIPFNNSCANDKSQMPTISMSGTGFEMAKPPSRHVKKTLPPTLSGFPGEAEIRYFVKATVNRHSFFKENSRAYTPFNFFPIEPPRPPSSGSEVFARQKHTFATLTGQEPVKSKMKGIFGLKKDNDLKSGYSKEAPFVSVDARLPEPAILNCNQEVPLRILVKKLNEFHEPIYLQSLQVSLIGSTKVRAHEVFRTETNSWVLMSKSNMGIVIGHPSDAVDTETVLDDRMWRGQPLPNTVAPSFETCNISRNYEVDVRVGLSYSGSSGKDAKPQNVVLPLRLSTMVYSGIAPPTEVLEAMAQAKTNVGQTTSTPAKAQTNASDPMNEKVRLEAQQSDFGANQVPPTPVDSPDPSGRPAVPPRKAVPSASAAESTEPTFEDAPPSYEDAIAGNVRPVNAPRPDYAPPPTGEDELLGKDEKKGHSVKTAHKLLRRALDRQRKSQDTFYGLVESETDFSPWSQSRIRRYTFTSDKGERLPRGVGVTVSLSTYSATSFVCISVSTLRSPGSKMTNHLVGDVYAKIIEEVIEASKHDFDDTGVGQGTLSELQQEWQAKLSLRGVAQMPWDPKPVAPPLQQSPSASSALPSAATNGLPQSYGYNGQEPRIKAEPGTEQQYGSVPPGYQQQQQQPQQQQQQQQQQQIPPQGGMARAQQLAQEYQMRGNQGLALPGQRPQGLHLPQQAQQNSQQGPSQYSPQQQQFMRQQQAALQQQQAQPRIKVENDSPQLQQGGIPQQQQQQQQGSNPAYAQTDGADDALEDWQEMLAQRRATHAANGERADRMMRDQAIQASSDLQSGLMVPLDEQPGRSLQKQRRTVPSHQFQNAHNGTPIVPQLDGDVDDDAKANVKDEDDENAINSDLDDSDEDPINAADDDDEEHGDTILCTYDKVQRVKNKWKCTLKDGVMSVGGKEWVFHKGMGEYEW